MLGMRIYTALLISFMAVLAYRFFVTKMPPWIAFLGEIIAIGCCWCPTVILYNYMTYLFLLLGAICLFRGLAGSRAIWLVFAGAFLGMNISVRMPNVLEAGLIIALWYYGSIKHKKASRILMESGLCILGYLIGFGISIGTISIMYGFGAFGQMIQGIFGMSSSASDYTLGEMLFSIFSAYGHGFKWLFYMALCVLPGVVFFMIKENYFPKVRKVLYCICIPVLFYGLSRFGMFNLKYYQKESALQWIAVFLLVTIGICLWLIFSNVPNKEWKLIGVITLLIVLITPLGSNNHIYPIMNNLFFVAPVTLWMSYKYILWGKNHLGGNNTQVPTFSAKAMLAGIMLAVMAQSIGIGFGYVFKDGEQGEKLDYAMKESKVLKGMYTNAENGENLQELLAFFNENQDIYADRELITYGNIPALCYYLDKPSALSASWADLDTTDANLVIEEIGDFYSLTIEERPVIIVTPQIASFISRDQQAMNWFSVDETAYNQDQKLCAIRQYIEDTGYAQSFENDNFIIYQ